jgi:hypothetical protein
VDPSEAENDHTEVRRPWWLCFDVTADDPAGLPTLEDCTDKCDDTEVSVPYSYVAFSSSLTPDRELSLFSLLD